MTHNPYLPCLNKPIAFPPFHNSLVSHRKHIRAHALTRPYPSDSYKAVFVFHTRTTLAYQLPAPTLPVHFLSSSTRSASVSLCHSFQTRCGFLEYIFDLINSWCSALQLLLAYTQTATNW
ncbi:unnamed protein product [Hymenolepis diminuta]|uniref:Uncharacterized protein n=1 Tax=Hymenolepis diminuta TaxID=6216 RepID=A0A564Y5Z9_HYMDI|nr:unnamed protein product [Hymenolepis diminuta]